MKKYILTIVLLGLISCTKPPVKTQIEPDIEKKQAETSIIDDSIDDSPKAKSRYSTIERGNATSKEIIKSQNMNDTLKQKKESKQNLPLLNLDDASLKEVIKVICDFKKWNYIMDPALPDKGVNIRMNEPLTDYNADTILQLIVSIQDISMVEREGIYYFSPAKAGEQKTTASLVWGNHSSLSTEGEGWVTQVIPLHFASSKGIIAIVKEFLSNGASIFEDPVNSTLIIVDRAPYIRKALEIIDLLDSNIFENRKMTMIRFENADAEKVYSNIMEIMKGYAGISEDKFHMITLSELNALVCISKVQEIIDEVKFWSERFEKESEVGEAQIFVYHVEHSDASDLSGIIEKLYTEGHSTSKNKEGNAELRPLLTGDFKIITDTTNNSLIFKTSKRDYNIILKTLKKLDTAKKQVLIEVKILDLSLTDNFSLGFSHFLANNTHENYPGAQNWNPTFSLSPGSAATTYNFLFDTQFLSSVLNLDETLEKTNILSTPKVLVLDNETASINIGDQISIETGSINVPGSTTTTNSSFYNSRSYQYLRTGINLKVKPTISSGGVIRLEIDQSHTIPGSAPEGGGNPPLKTRDITTVVQVPDGKSVLLGGMINETRTDTNNAVPILGHIPLIKYFFSGKIKNTSKSELLIVLTPHILYSPEDVVGITEEFKKEIEKFRFDLYGKEKND